MTTFAVLAVVIVACNELTTRTPNAPSFSANSTSTARLGDKDVRIQYGPAVKVGNGIVRTYIATQKDNRDVPVEIDQEAVVTEAALGGA